ncbi:MAG TPA: AAA family ATPase [Actinomycetota bacterium]|nr:AAA family ATPase [Actinomycetota bacterium]
MVFRNKLKYWAPKILTVVVVYTIISWTMQLYGTCGDPLTGVRECGPIDVITRLGSGIFFALQLFMFIVLQLVGMMWFLSRGRKYVIYPKEYETTFDDVRGQKPVVESVQEVVKLFRGFREFKKIGGYPPHGLLFEGPPGTGKTLMAKAVAGQVGVPFIYAPASGFTNAIMGAGIMQIAMLFRKAKKFSRLYDGCVIFIDEIDAIGSRGGGMAMASEANAEPRRGTMINRLIMGGMGGGSGAGAINELLIQMDGMIMPRGLKRHIRRMFGLKPKIPQHNILVIGATNRANDLDPALLRPGRFDRKIHIGLPDKEGRKDVIRYYLEKVKHEEIDLDRFAQATIYYSPARIKNIINEGLIVALQDGRDALTWDDIWAAKMIDDIGLKQAVTYTEREKLMTAVHEAGHAVVNHELMKEDMQIQIITIIKRESALGMVYSVDRDERFGTTKEEVLNRIRVSLAGLVAEEMWFGTTTSGTSSDLRNVTAWALNYVGTWGMGNRLFSYDVLYPTQFSNSTEAMLKDPDVRREVNELLHRCKQDVREILEKRRFAVERIRDELLAKDELVGEQLQAVMQEINEQIAASEAQSAAPVLPPSSPPPLPGPGL